MGFSVQVKMYADSGPDATVEFTSPPGQPVSMQELGARIGDVVRALKPCVGGNTDELFLGIKLTLGAVTPPKPSGVPAFQHGRTGVSAPDWRVDRSGTDEVVFLTLPLNSPSDAVSAAMQQVPEKYRHTAELLLTQEMTHQQIRYRRPFTANAVTEKDNTQPAGAPPRKSLGQVAYETRIFNDVTDASGEWHKSCNHVAWERVGTAVEAEVLRRQLAPGYGLMNMETILATLRELLCEPGVLYTWLTAAELERAKSQFSVDHPLRAALDTLVPRPDKGQLTENASQPIVPAPTGRSSSEPEDKY